MLHRDSSLSFSGSKTLTLELFNKILLIKLQNRFIDVLFRKTYPYPNHGEVLNFGQPGNQRKKCQ